MSFCKLHYGEYVARIPTGISHLDSREARDLPRHVARLASACAGTAISTSGTLPVYSIVLIGFFHSIMFPTIFALGIKNLGPYTKRGSSLLVMAIIGAAVFPPIMGRISDLSNIQRAFLVPLISYAYVLYFAMRGSRPALATQQDPVLEVASSEAE